MTTKLEKLEGTERNRNTTRNDMCLSREIKMNFMIATVEVNHHHISVE